MDYARNRRTTELQADVLESAPKAGIAPRRILASHRQQLLDPVLSEKPSPRSCRLAAVVIEQSAET
jgi:hypothetical protein